MGSIVDRAFSACTPLDGTPLDGTPLDGTPLDGTPLEGTPLDGTPLDGTPLDGGRRRTQSPPMRRLALLVLLTACAPEGPPDGLPGPPPAGEWIAIEPGGDTICSRGTPYRFFVRGGRPDRVMIDFQGGGACWDELTCGFADGTGFFSQDVGTLEEFVGFVESSGDGGILSDHPDNPFRDWTIVHVPYCTGDVHWGDATAEYGSAGTIEHRGFVNATAALDWTYTRFLDPARVFVSGCSAGAYGAILHSAYIADHYGGDHVSVFADSGAGIITDSFLMDSLPNWNAEPNLPSAFVPGLAIPITDLTLPDLYIEIGRTFPDMRLAQTQTQYDQDQVFFYTAMGGRGADWPGAMRSNIDRIRGEIDNFTAYVPGGSMHCAAIYPFFLTREVNGVPLRDFTEALALGEALPEPALCEGAACCSDPVCEACAAAPMGTAPGYCRFCMNWPTSWPECAPMP